MIRLLGRNLFILLIVLLVSGCHSAPSEEIVLRILSALTASSILKAQRDKAGAEFVHFARKRIRWLIGENSSWDSAPEYTALTGRLKMEMQAIDAYLQSKVGTPDTPGPLGGETDTTSFPHLDLRDVGKIFTDDDATTVDGRVRNFVEARRRRVRRIVWRAVAIHTNLWTGSSAAVNTSLETTALDELLDRRLRFVERMRHNDGSSADRALVWTISAAASWKDKMRTVIAEYPFINLNKARTDPFSTGVDAAGRTLSGLHPDWFLIPDPKNMLRFRPSFGRPRPGSGPHWNLGGYSWTMQLAGKTPAQIIDLLLPSTPLPADLEDFWNRNWMFCDHMAAALEVDALRLGLRRRTGSDTEFNDAADDGVTLAVPIPQTSSPDPDDLMDEGDDYFEGVMIDGSDLQIGDLVIIWNNWFMRTIFATDFGLENSIISDITADDPRKAKLVGHGAPEGTYTEFVEGLLGAMVSNMKAFRKKVTDAINAADPAHDYLLVGGVISITNPVLVDLVYWDPFDEGCVPLDPANQILQVPGAWWVRIKLSQTGLSLSDALNLFPKSVVIEVGFHTPPKMLADHAANYRESIYLPLSAPNAVRGGWAEYFKNVREDIEAGLPVTPGTKLVDLPVDQDWAPGYHYAGPTTKIPVLRPKVRT